MPRLYPSKNEDLKKTYSGKKQFTFNTTMLSNIDGLIIWTDRTSEGVAGDMTLTHDDPIALGRRIGEMTKQNGHVITILTDKIYQDIQRLYPGVVLVQPVKKPRGGRLTTGQKRNNKKPSSGRIIVGPAIERIKHWDIMKGPYEGTIDDFTRELSVTTGLANLHLLWDPKKKASQDGFLKNSRHICTPYIIS